MPRFLADTASTASDADQQREMARTAMPHGIKKSTAETMRARRESREEEHYLPGADKRSRDIGRATFSHAMRKRRQPKARPAIYRPVGILTSIARCAVTCCHVVAVSK